MKAILILAAFLALAACGGKNPVKPLAPKDSGKWCEHKGDCVYPPGGKEKR